MMMYHYIYEVNMDTSDEEGFSQIFAILLTKEKL